jgi:hypothetical protein
MSFGPIYAKIREMEERLNNVENSPNSRITMSSPTLSSDIDSDRLNNLLNDCSTNSTSITRLYSDLGNYATKDELVPLATKDELVPLATKDELVPLATKDELVPLATKDELVPLATKDELATLATKDELVPLATKDELVPLATKDELVPLATKDELVDLLAKLDNIINVVGQLNTRIDDLATKIPA